MTQTFLLRELSRYRIGTFADIIYRNALLHPDDEAFVCESQRVTFSQYNERVNSLVRALQALGLKKGEVLGVLSWNNLEYMDVHGAAMKGGFISSPFNPRLHPNELEYLINYSEASVLFVDPAMAETANALKSRLPRVKHFISIKGADDDGMIPHDEMLQNHPPDEPEIDIHPDDPVLIFYTSGTTGLPRGALYTHSRKLNSTRIKNLEMGIKGGDRHIAILPLFHIGGDSHVWPFYCVGGCNVIMPQRSFDPDITLQVIQDERATDIQIVPPQLGAMMKEQAEKGYKLSTLKRIYYAASPMPLELLRQGLELFGPIFSQGYGQTESGPQICSLPRKEHEVLDKSEEEQKILLSCGQPSPGVQVRVVDESNQDVGPGEVGEIIARSGSIMVEYWRKPEETADTIIDGWLHTGDLAYYDERGFLYIVDRKKDMIVTGGENVYSREVEDVLYKHPAVVEAAVIGVSDPVWVERVHAEIALKDGTEVDESEIISFCKEHIASYKSPKSVAFVDALPKNPQGKILKREIKEKYKEDKE
jgi:acyl-CoA synthetase (AMP-forming)/AMP-acid ligase II